MVVDMAGSQKACAAGRTERTFAVCRLYNPYLLCAGSAQWNQALSQLMLMPPSWVGMLILSTQTGHS